jgi:hypothetical protein
MQMNFKDMIKYCKRGNMATRLSWFESLQSVRYIASNDFETFYVGHFPDCTVMSGDNSEYEDNAIDEERNAVDWIPINNQDLKVWRMEVKRRQATEKEQSLITSVIDNGLMGNYIGSNLLDIDKEIK